MRLQVQPGVDSKSNIKSTIRDREEVEVEVEERTTSSSCSSLPPRAQIERSTTTEDQR